jgi:hypothetical protein
MKEATPKKHGGRRPGSGRPATGKDPVRTIRLSDEFLDKVDHWATQQEDQPSRSEAIRQLVEVGLSKSGTPRRPKVLSTAKQSAARAAELAAKTIDRHIDPKAPPEERETMARKLVEGPSIFRDARKDRP